MSSFNLLHLNVQKILEPGDINRVEEHEEHEYDNMTNIPGKYIATIKEDDIRVIINFLSKLLRKEIIINYSTSLVNRTGRGQIFFFLERVW